MKGAFKVPTLRNVELTGPYMHNGSMSTLEQVVEFYNRGGNFDNIERAPDLISLGLNDREKIELVTFLRSLTDERVRWEKAPFDHPELMIPNGHIGDTHAVASRIMGANKVAKDKAILLSAVGRDGRANDPLRPFHEYLSE